MTKLAVRLSAVQPSAGGTAPARNERQPRPSDPCHNEHSAAIIGMALELKVRRLDLLLAGRAPPSRFREGSTSWCWTHGGTFNVGESSHVERLRIRAAFANAVHDAVGCDRHPRPPRSGTCTHRISGPAGLQRTTCDTSPSNIL